MILIFNLFHDDSFKLDLIDHLWLWNLHMNHVKWTFCVNPKMDKITILLKVYLCSHRLCNNELLWPEWSVCVRRWVRDRSRGSLWDVDPDPVRRWGQTEGQDMLVEGCWGWSSQARRSKGRPETWRRVMMELVWGHEGDSWCWSFSSHL